MTTTFWGHGGHGRDWG